MTKGKDDLKSPRSPHPKWAEMAVVQNESYRKNAYKNKKNNLALLNEFYGTKLTLNQVYRHEKIMKRWVRVLPELNAYEILPWEEILTGKIPLHKAIARQEASHRILKLSDEGNHWAFLIGTLLSFTMTVLKILTLDPSDTVKHAMGNVGLGQVGNHIDTACGLITGYYLIKEGDVKLGRFVLGASAVDFLCTIGGIIGTLSPELIAAGVSTALIGYAVPFMMCVGALVEQNEIHKLHNAIRSAEFALSNPEVPLTNEAFRAHTLSILVNRAKIKDHRKSQIVWLGCALVMTIAATLTMMSLPMGGPIAILAMVAGVSVLAGICRLLWVGKDKNLKHLSQIKGSTLTQWFELTNELYAKTNSPDTSLLSTANNTRFFINTIKKSIEKLLINSPDKAEKIIGILHKFIEPPGKITLQEYEFLREEYGKTADNLRESVDYAKVMPSENSAKML